MWVCSLTAVEFSPQCACVSVSHTHTHSTAVTQETGMWLRGRRKVQWSTNSFEKPCYFRQDFVQQQHNSPLHHSFNCVFTLVFVYCLILLLQSFFFACDLSPALTITDSLNPSSCAFPSSLRLTSPWAAPLTLTWSHIIIFILWSEAHCQVSSIFICLSGVWHENKIK